MSFESEFSPYKKKKTNDTPKKSNSSFESQFAPKPQIKPMVKYSEPAGPPNPTLWQELKSNLTSKQKKITGIMLDKDKNIFKKAAEGTWETLKIAPSPVKDLIKAPERMGLPQQLLFKGINSQIDKDPNTDIKNSIGSALRSHVTGTKTKDTTAFDLLDKAGWKKEENPNGKWFNPTTWNPKNTARNITGVAAEIFLDPMNLAFGAGGASKLSKLKKGEKLLSKVDDVAKGTKVLDEVASTSEKLLPETDIIVSSKPKSKLNFLEKAQNIYSKHIDSQHPIARLGDDVKVKASNSRQVGGTVDHILEEGLVSREGQQIGKSLKEIATKIPKEKEEDFWKYMLHKHNIARTKQGKPVFPDFTPEMSAQKAQQLLKSNPEFEGLSKELNQFMNTLTDEWAVKGGMISRELADNLKQIYPDYIPTYRSFDELEKTVVNGAKRGFVNQTNTIKGATGSARPIINPLESIAQMVNKTVRASRYNEVGQEILNLARQGADKVKGLVEIIPTQQELLDDINKTLVDDGIEGLTERFANEFDQVFTKNKPKGENIVTVMENGLPVQLKVKDKSLLEAILKIGEGDITKAEELGRAFTNPMKQLITSKNPFFTVKNIARDLPNAYINSVENNPFKFGKNYLKAYKDMAKNTDTFKEFKALGGMESGFFKNDISKVKSQLMKTPSKFSKVLNGIEYINNMTEVAPRYAEYLNTVQKGGSKAKGIYNAAEVTTNFARSGRYGRAIDSFTPYYNAGMQGFDKFIRQVVNKPLQTIGKSVVAITAPTLLVSQMNKNNRYYKELDNRTKDTNYLIPNIFNLDDNGTPQTFIKIPKTRQYGVLMGSLTERILRKFSDEKDAFKGYVNSLATDFAPVNPAESNIFAPLLLNIPRNKDFADRYIVPLGMILDNRSPYLQYDETTSEIGKKLGELMNWSPKQIDYLIKSYTGVIGQVLLPSTTKGQNAIDAILRQFTSDPTYNNQALTNFYDNLEKVRAQATNKNILENIPSKKVTQEEAIRNRLNKFSDEISKINKQIKKTPDKNEKIKLKKQINDIAIKANTLYNSQNK